jgi:AbiU2
MNADTEMKANRVRTTAARLARDAERIVALRRFFEEGNTRSVAESLGRHEEGIAATLVRAAVFEAMALALARACDTAADVQSIPTAASLLRDQAVFDEVAKEGNADALAGFVVISDELAKNESRERVRRLRSYVIAHHLPTKYADGDRTEIIDLYWLAQLVLPASEKLCEGAGVDFRPVDAIEKMWTAPTQAYWGRLLSATKKGRNVD